jgi:hypothetical protein
MQCRIKGKRNEIYFKQFLGFNEAVSKKDLQLTKVPECSWVYKEYAKIFDSVAEAKALIKTYKLTNAKIEKIYKNKGGKKCTK